MKKNKKVIVILLVFLCAFSIGIKKTLAIYKEKLNTKVYLSILNPSSSVVVNFESEGGSSVNSMTLSLNESTGPLPTPIRADYYFLGWFKSDGTPADPNENLLANVTYYAHWQKIVCKKVTDPSKLHTEICLGSSGCLSGTGFSKNGTITYGSTFDSAPVAGNAYDCDVDNDGVYNPQDPNNSNKYTERFYFVRQKENAGDEDTAVLSYYTAIDSQGIVDYGRIHASSGTIESVGYNEALNYLPKATAPTNPNWSVPIWDNPELIDLDGNGKISRFLSIEDYEAVCGSPFNTTVAYFTDCQQWFFFENSRFQSSTLSRSGIWVEPYNNTYYRLQTGSVALQAPSGGATSQNMARPAIEIPITALEGYQNTAEYTISFDTHGGSTVEDYVRYRGQAIGTLPTTTRPHYNFDGWYANFSNDVYSNPVSPQTVVTGNATYHAKWIPKTSSTVTFIANGGTVQGEATLNVTVDTGDPIGTLPVPTWSDHSFVGWYRSFENGAYSDRLLDTDPINSNITVYAKWQMSNSVAMIGDTYYETLADAIDDVPRTNTKTRIVILKDITLTSSATITTDKWVELDIGSYVISGNVTLIGNNGKLDIINGIINNTGNSANTSNAIENGAVGVINMTGGTVLCSAQGAAINNRYGGTLNVSGGQIKGSNTIKGQAIYIEKSSLVTISGDAYLENVSVSSGTASRATVDNNGGTLLITGGTIVSSQYTALENRANGATTTIGIDDDSFNITTPVLRGQVYGLNVSKGKVYVYDGIFESLNNTRAFTGTVTKPNNIDFADSTTDVSGVTYHSTFLAPPTLTVKFFPENGESTFSITVNNGDTIGIQMPNDPTKTGYYFDGWYDGNTLITSSSTVVQTINAHAKWVQSISNATINNTLTVERESDENISITGTDIESVTYISSNDSIATVDSTGKVTGVNVGTATITITGVKSEETRTVVVTVTPIHYIVTFLDSNDQELFTRSIEENTALGAQMPSNPTKDNFVFNAWYIDGNPIYEFTNANIVTGDLTVVANWKEKVTYATLSTSPSPFEIVVGNTGQISLSATTQNGVIEGYTFTSGSTSIATVDSSGLVTAAAIGNTDIFVVGSLSGATATVHVVVKPLTHSVTFMDGDDVYTSVEVADGSSIGDRMPDDPTKDNYIFDGWYINGDPLREFNDSTNVTGGMNVKASWSPSIQLATIPESFAVAIGTTGTISVTGPSGMEGYTFTSGSTSIATVDNNGVVTGVALGTTNITITGSRSNTQRTVEVSITRVPIRTITFMDDDNLTVFASRQVEDGESIDTSDGVSMPNNPTKTNYIFDGWYIVNGNSLLPFTSSTEVTGGDLIVTARWKETIAIATITTIPDPLRIMVGHSGTINVAATGGGSVEPHTFSSSNSNIASVDNNGLVFGEDTGTVTITVSGTVSGSTQTVQAEVVNTYKVIFDVDDDEYSSKDVMPNEALGDLPTPPTKTGYVFVGWYTTFAAPYTTRIDEETVINSDKRYYARWAEDTNEAEMNNELYSNVQAAVDAAPSSKTTIRLLKNVTYSKMINLYDTSNNTPVDNQTKNIVLDLNNFSITNNSTYALRTRATMEIKNGTINGKAGSGAFETTGSTATLVLRNVNMNITGTRQAIYNDGGIVDIYGGTFSAKADYASNNKRGTIQNQGGTINIHDGNFISSATGTKTGIAVTVNGGVVNIYGGSISSTDSNTGYGVYVNGGSATIGIKDSKHDISKITIQGKTNGVYAGQPISFYDGVIEAINPSNAINDESKIVDFETGATMIKNTGTVDEVVYNRLYYDIASTLYRIDFEANQGTVSPLYKEFIINSQITASDLPTPTRGGYQFDGWYTDFELTQPFAAFTPSSAATVTYYAKWSSFVSSLTPVSHNVLSDAMVDYFSNVSSWVAADPTDPSNDPNDDANASNGYDNGHHLFKNSLSQVFTSNGCSSCQADNKCDNPSVGTYCDQPKGYDTGLSDDLNVYLYTNGEKDSEIVSYITSTGGKIYNMIPGETYYWESATDNTKYGVVTATGQRRTLKTAVRNLRDFGGLSVSYVDPSTQEVVNGTIEYGKMYRGAQITSAQGVTDLYKLGVTREVDVRGNGDGNQTYKLTNYDTGTSNPSNYTDIEITNYIINPVATPYIATPYDGNYDALKSAMRAVMEAVVFNDDNIFFHCTIGTDRTGTLAYFLEGLLGVSEEDRLRDYELTYFFGLTNRNRFHDSVSWSNIRPRFYSMYRSYPTNTDIYNYYKFKTHTVNPNNPNDLSDDELLSRFRGKMIG